MAAPGYEPYAKLENSSDAQSQSLQAGPTGPSRPGVQGLAASDQHHQQPQQQQEGQPGAQAVKVPATSRPAATAGLSRPGIASYGSIPTSVQAQPVTQQPQSFLRPFDVSLLDSRSVPVYSNIGTFHKSGRRLYSALHSTGEQLLHSLDTTTAASRNYLSYEDLLQTLTHDGEHILTNEWRLLYKKAIVYDCETAVSGGDPSAMAMVEELPNGAAILTNKRLLLLSASVGQGMSLVSINEKKSQRFYDLSASHLDNVHFKPIPLRNMASVELSAASGSKISASLTQKGPCCWGFCCCCSCCSSCVRKEWTGTLGQPVNYNSRTLKIGLRRPPWDRRSMLHLEITDDLPLTVARDFIVLLQRHSPAISGSAS